MGKKSKKESELTPFGRRLETLLKKKKYTQRRLAKNIHLSEVELSNIKTGKRGLTLENAKLIAGVLDCDYRYLTLEIDRSTMAEVAEEQYEAIEQQSFVVGNLVRSCGLDVNQIFQNGLSEMAFGGDSFLCLFNDFLELKKRIWNCACLEVEQFAVNHQRLNKLNAAGLEEYKRQVDDLVRAVQALQATGDSASGITTAPPS